MTLEITKMLVLSTGHLTEYACNEFFDTYRHAHNKGEFGGFVYVPTDDCPVMDGDELPGCLIDCLKFADANDCGWVMFDCDGPIIDDLPEYLW